MIGPDRTVMLLVQKVAGTTLVAKVLKRIDLQPGQEVLMTFPGPDGGRVVRGMAVAAVEVVWQDPSCS